jgi:hypothetical protein
MFFQTSRNYCGSVQSTASEGGERVLPHKSDAAKDFGAARFQRQK